MSAWGLHDRVVVVTGASSGSGVEIVNRLVDEGASVVASGRNGERLAQTVERARAAGGDVVGVTADLASISAADEIVRAAVEAHGRIDVLVSNAALYVPSPIEETTPELLESQWRVNVATPLELVRRALPQMGASGAIVFVTSTVTHVGFSGYSAYTATKGAVEAMAKALAVELAPRGVRVNAVAPGFIRTPMLQPALDANPDLEGILIASTPLGRLGERSDVATAVLFLASNLSANVASISLVSDGGWVAQ